MKMEISVRPDLEEHIKRLDQHMKLVREKQNSKEGRWARQKRREFIANAFKKHPKDQDEDLTIPPMSSGDHPERPHGVQAVMETDKDDDEVRVVDSCVQYLKENLTDSDSDSEDDTNQGTKQISDGDYAPDSMSSGELEMFFTDSDDTGPVIPNSVYGYTGIINNHNTCYFNATIQMLALTLLSSHFH